jgi:glycosyltransferase involved in cell wall biosynthesis
MPKAIVCVTNDLSTDQRVYKTCMTLQQCGYEVVEYGRILPGSVSLERTFQTKRVRHFFNSKALFYAEYNIRLFFYLLFHPSDLIFANDLDTLPAAYLVSKIKKTRLIYDTHEYFTETPELVNRPKIQRIWEKIESWIFPNLQSIITVNQSIADLYQKKYKKKLVVVRNIPSFFEPERIKSRKELQLPEDKKILIIQGTGINVDRGAEEACRAMKYLDNTVLLIIGSGDVFPDLKIIIENEHLQNKVIIKPKMSFQELRQYTIQSDLGLSIDKDTNLNYRFSLPNKLFDYIHAGIPVLTSNLPEIRKITDEFHLGFSIENHHPEHIAEVISRIFNNEIEYMQAKSSTIYAKEILNWKEEQKTLIQLINEKN